MGPALFSSPYYSTLVGPSRTTRLFNTGSAHRDMCYGATSTLNHTFFMPRHTPRTFFYILLARRIGFYPILHINGVRNR